MTLEKAPGSQRRQELSQMLSARAICSVLVPWAKPSTPGRDFATWVSYTVPM
jgi:hypothetical protein